MGWIVSILILQYFFTICPANILLGSYMRLNLYLSLSVVLGLKLGCFNLVFYSTILFF